MLLWSNSKHLFLILKYNCDIMKNFTALIKSHDLLSPLTSTFFHVLYMFLCLTNIIYLFLFSKYFFLFILLKKKLKFLTALKSIIDYLNDNCYLIYGEELMYKKKSLLSLSLHTEDPITGLALRGLIHFLTIVVYLYSVSNYIYINTL